MNTRTLPELKHRHGVRRDETPQHVGVSELDGLMLAVIVR